jgi:pyruvate dehydrogenase (quinone)
MACAHAKFTGEVGVCLATSGPGAIHLLNGLYDAKLDHQPVVAIVGQQARAALGGSYQQEVDLITLFKDVAMSTCTWPPRRADAPPGRPRHAHRDVGGTHRHLHHHSERRAGARRGRDAAAQARDHSLRHRAVAAARRPATRICARAADVLNAGKKVAILVGAGALQCDRRGDRGGGQARRRRRQGAARQGGAARRSAVRDRRSACSAPGRAGT